MPSHAIEALADKAAAKADRAIATLKGVRARARANEARAYHLAETAAGGIAAGAADAYFNEPELFGIPAVPLVSAGLALLGVLEIVPGGEHMGSFGAGGLSYALGSAAFKKVNEWEEKP